MNMPKFDFFNALSAAAAVLGAYAAWKSYKTSKRIEELQDLKLDVVVKDISYEAVPDTHGHHIKLQITNLSTIATLVKKMSIQLHSRTYDVHFDESPVLEPFTPTEVSCTMGSWGTDVLDGRYPATLIIEADRKTVSYPLRESDLIGVFHHAVESDQ